MMWFENDTATPTLDIGEYLVNFASTHPSFALTPVWEGISMEIDPVDTLKRYYSEDGGDYRFETQGLITFAAASILPVTTSFGSVFLDYHFSFSAPEADLSVESVASGGIELICALYAATEDEPMVFRQGGTANPSFILSGGLDWEEGALYYGAIVEQSGVVNFKTTDYPGSTPLKVGMGLWIKAVSTTVSGVTFLGLIPYANLSDASESFNNVSGASQLVATGQLAYADTIVTTMSVTLEIRKWSASDLV
jgi:hypothetical protein